jgi:DNA-binding transcriptional regulator PaaX
MVKLKYYFRKPKSEIVKDLFKWLLMAGVIYLAASSPYFVLDLQKNFKRWRKYQRKDISNTFARLKRKGYINIEKKNHQIYISLTEQGRKKAGWFQIDALKIKRPKKWDKKYRIVIFDISQLKKIYREALRGKLKELGFYPFQKSVWLHAFDCRDEIELLKEFFGLSDEEMRLIIAEDIGKDTKIKQFFKI